MKSTDWQIGDWGNAPILADKTKENSFYYLQVENISKDILQLGIFRLLYSQVEPIPLTPEILKTNRFEHYKETNGYVLQTTTASITLLWDYWYKCFCWHEAKIRNVHELQHILRMCDMNERADNFKIE